MFSNGPEIFRLNPRGQRLETIMITRRAFLQGSAGTAAGLILPSWLVEAENHIDIEAKPYLEPPAREDVTIHAVDWGADEYQLSVGDPYADPPDITWREMLNWQGFGSLDEYYGTDDPQSLPEYSLDDRMAKHWAKDRVEISYPATPESDSDRLGFGNGSQ